MWELDCEESWALKNWCFWTVVLEKTLESPLDCKEIQPVNPKGNQSWIFIGRTDVEAETPILWPPDVKNWLIRRLWCWARLKAGGEGDDRGWAGWMASLIRWTWVWASSGRWWRTGKPGVMQSTGSQRVGHDWATEQQQRSIHSLNPLIAKSVLCAHESASLSQISSCVCVFYLIPRIRDIKWYMCLSAWLTSLRMIMSKTTQVPAHGIILSSV